ncbi:hypothetical protein VdG1_08245 [Verticillium dahliae VDG1]|nr:hypothetical protein VdG1_08245 [Verticillium dahliae VDG1]
MQDRLYARSTGDLTPQALARSTTTELLRSFTHAPQHRFDGETDEQGISRTASIWAHRAGVNALALDKFDGRHLLSGGADGALRLWDLDHCGNPHERHTFRPIADVPRSARDSTDGHKHGITHLGFYPFDSDAFLSSSFDRTLKLWSTKQMRTSASFDLETVIHSHATSPLPGHLLVACATQHSAVRLVDLKSGSAVQSLAAQGGAVLSVAWSPRHEHVLASGHADGRVRVWDVRRASGVIGMLDHEDSLGIVHRFDHAMASGMSWDDGPHSRAAARAHDDSVNGLCWTDDGKYLVSAGLDRRIRVWDAATGANTLASFGSIVQNSSAGTASLFASPSGLTAGHRDLLFWPNEQEILVLDLHEGTLLTRLRVPGPPSVASGQAAGGLNIKNRTMSMVWRGAGGQGLQNGTIMGSGSSFGAILTAHLDGQIRVWMPQLPGPEDDDPQEAAPDDDDEDAKQRKRKAVDDAFKSLMGRQVTFT